MIFIYFFQLRISILVLCLCDPNSNAEKECSINNDELWHLPTYIYCWKEDIDSHEM